MSTSSTPSTPSTQTSGTETPTTGSDDLRNTRRTRISAAWVLTGIGALLLLLLVIFIAQNGQHVTVHFLGASGSMSLAVGLLASGVAGALIVLLVGAVRITQLRLAARRHSRGDRAST
jgi:uncharacterized integral membrane protein